MKIMYESINVENIMYKSINVEICFRFFNHLFQWSQEIFEPGCRCFLEETAGQLENGTIDLIPQDCEFDSTTGALDGDLMCSDATDALLEAASM